MKILLCDDDPDFLQQLEQKIREYFKNKAKDIYISCINDTASLSKDLITSCDILFMDIFLPSENGINLLAKWQENLHCQIVFVTSSTDYAIEAFQLNARHYLVKPLSDAAIADALDRCLQFLSQEKEELILEISTSYGFTPVSQKQIFYIEVFNTLSTIHTSDSEIQTYTSLSSLYNSLDPSKFMRPNRSYIVNMDYIQSFHPDHLIMKNSERISLSRLKRKELREQYHKFLFDKARSAIL